MKKLVTLSLMVLLACLVAGIAPLRYGLKQRARAKMHRRLKQECPDATLTWFSDTALKAAVWEKEDEFRLNGRLYDVARVVWRDGIRYYVCVNDQLEQHLERQADTLAGELLNRPATPGGRLAKALLDWLKGFYLPPGGATVPVYCTAAVRPGTAELPAPVLHPYLDRVFPPPKA